MSAHGPTAGNMTGSLLVAHPSLLDPNFRRTILYLSHHSAEDGAIGLVLNRPMKKTFGEVAPKHSTPGLRSVELFYGGPVDNDRLMLASLQWRENPDAVVFHPCTDEVGDGEIGPEWQPGLRAFAGYSGWTQGQLENEIAQKAWIVLPPARDLIEMEDPETAWRDVMRNSGPLFKLLAEAPDDPSLN